MTGNTALENGVIAAFAVLVVQGFFRFLAQFITGRDKQEQGQLALLDKVLDRFATSIDKLTERLSAILLSDEELRKENAELRETMRSILEQQAQTLRDFDSVIKKLEATVDRLNAL